MFSGVDPSTGQLYGVADLETLNDPHVNLDVGCRYLGRLLKDFDGDLERAVAAGDINGDAFVDYTIAAPGTAMGTDFAVDNAFDAELKRGWDVDAIAGKRVVCLGDLFDVWVGRCQLALSGTAPVPRVPS